jgi:hypothetical protein
MSQVQSKNLNVYGTMESYEQERCRLDGAMPALLRIIERELKATRRVLAALFAAVDQRRDRRAMAGPIKI